MYTCVRKLYLSKVYSASSFMLYLDISSIINRWGHDRATGGTSTCVCNLAQFCVFFRTPTRIFVHTLGFQPEGNLRGNSTGKLMHSLSIPDAFPNGTTLYILYPDRPTFSIHLISDLSSKKWKKVKKNNFILDKLYIRCILVTSSWTYAYASSSNTKENIEVKH